MTDKIEMPGTYVCFEDMQEFMAQSDRIKELQAENERLKSMYAALKEISGMTRLHELHGDTCELCKIVRLAKNAIAKAEGKQ